MSLRPIFAGSPLFASFRSHLEKAGLPVDDLLAEPARYYALGASNDDADAFGGLLALGDEAVLRSIVTPEHARGRGFGQAIVGALAAMAARDGAKRLWLLTTSAEAFFNREGWTTAPRDEAPASIAATRQFSTTCPASAALMRRVLR